MTNDLYSVPFTVTITAPSGTTVTVRHIPGVAVAELPVSVVQPHPSDATFSLSELIQVAAGLLLGYWIRRRDWPLETRPIPSATDEARDDATTSEEERP